MELPGLVIAFDQIADRLSMQDQERDGRVVLIHGRIILDYPLEVFPNGLIRAGVEIFTTEAHAVVVSSAWRLDVFLPLEQEEQHD
jgi:hypothetical protein